MHLVDRVQELSFLQRQWEGPASSLTILYGRRRVGKTELLRHFSRDLRHVFYVATQSSAADQLRSFAVAVQQGLSSEAAGVSFSDWDAAFEFLAARSGTEPLVVVLDEFPYLVHAHPPLPSLLQRAWDTRLRSTRVRLVLSGSSISFMESELLAHRSPLYGRRTGQFLVQPLDFSSAADFFPHASPEERVELYATLGGMPAYLAAFDANQSLWSNVEHKILARGAFLHEEVPFLLMQELREPRIYLSILRAIAEGRTRQGEIAERALGSGQAAKTGFYLQTLQDLRLVERRVPVSETVPHKSRKGIYVLSDPFVRFWMRFVFPETSALEVGITRPVLDKIKLAWSDFVAPVFEEICRDRVRRGSPKLELPFLPFVVGQWWTSQRQIDVVAFDDTRNAMFCGECKWSKRPVGLDVLETLRRNAAHLAAEVGVNRIHLGIFARRGFTEALEKQARNEGVALYPASAL